VAFFFNEWIEPVFSAETKLLIEEKLQDVNLTKNMLLPYQKEFFETQRGILESEPVFESVVLELGLHKRPTEESISGVIMDRLAELIGIKYELTAEQKERDTIEKAVRRLRKRTFVEAARGTNILGIHVESTDAGEAMLVANTLAEKFVRRSLYLKNKDSYDAHEFLESQVQDVQSRLLLAEQSLSEFQFTSAAISLDKRIEFLVENQLIVAEKELSDVQRELEEEREKIEILHLQVVKERGRESSGDRGTFKLLTEQQLQLELAMNRLLRDFTPAHPEVVAVQTQLDTIKERIDAEQARGKAGEQQSSNEFLQSLEKAFSEAQRNYRVLAVRYHELQKHIDNLQEKLKDLLNKKSKFLVLQRELNANEKLYELLLIRSKEVGVESTLNVGHVKQIQQAVLPVRPVRPKKLLNLLVGAFLGFVLGVGFAFLREYMDPSIKDKDEICNMFSDLPLLGLFREEEILRKEKHLVPTVSFTNPNSMLGESFRILTANMKMFKDSGHKKILVTSSLPGEGKSTISSNLAISFALRQQKVLLLDCDLRKPKLADFFELSPTASEHVFSTNIPGLSVFKAPRVKDTALYLASEEFNSFLSESEKNFDFMVIDSAPVNLVSDTANLVAMKIPVLFVVGAGKTTSEQLLRAREIFRSLNAELVGFAISRFEETAMPRGYKNYYEAYSLS
jgi:capsular exopolysaccharide synthesis family protein